LAVADDGLRPSSMTGTGWRFIADNPGIACWTACSGRDVTFLLIPVEEARVYGYAARTRGGTTGTDRSWLALMAKGFPDPLGTAVAQALAGGELHHGPVDEVRLERWHNARLVLIGDAAHATGPVWAQGVAMALEDAVVLGELLARTPAEHWTGVGAAFERLRRPRVDHVQSATDRMSRLAAPGLAAGYERTHPGSEELSGGLCAAPNRRQPRKEPSTAQLVLARREPLKPGHRCQSVGFRSYRRGQLIR